MLNVANPYSWIDCVGKSVQCPDTFRIIKHMFSLSNDINAIPANFLSEAKEKYRRFFFTHIHIFYGNVGQGFWNHYITWCGSPLTPQLPLLPHCLPSNISNTFLYCLIRKIFDTLDFLMKCSGHEDKSRMLGLIHRNSHNLYSPSVPNHIKPHFASEPQRCQCYLKGINEPMIEELCQALCLIIHGTMTG